MSEVSITYEKLYELLRREKDNADIQSMDLSFFRDVVKYLNDKNTIFEESKHKTDLFSAAERENTATQLRNVRRLIKELYNRRESKIITMAINKSRTDTNIIDTSALLPEEKAMYDHLVQTMGSFRKGVYLHLISQKIPHIPGLDIETYIEQQKKANHSIEAQPVSQAYETGGYEPAASMPSESDAGEVPYVPESVVDDAASFNPDKVQVKAEQPKETEPGVVETPSVKVPEKGGDKMTVKFLSETSKFVGKELEIYGPYNAGDITSLPSDIAKVLIARGSAQEV